MAETAIWRVGYHGGSLFSLVETDRPERAVEIAKAHREVKPLYRGAGRRLTCSATNTRSGRRPSAISRGWRSSGVSPIPKCRRQRAASRLQRVRAPARHRTPTRSTNGPLRSLTSLALPD